MPRPKTSPRERIERLSERQGHCLIWKGQLENDRPRLKGVGNPVRVLLNIDSRYI